MAELKCPSCDAGIVLGQDFCAKCGLALKSKRGGGWFTKIVKGIGFFVVAIFVVGVIAGLADRKPSLASTAPIAPEPAVIDVSASNLATAYERNGVAADARYKGQALRVTGSVTGIATDVFNHAVVSLDGGVNQFLQPHAVLNDSDKPRAGSLNVGQHVTLTCIGAGDVIKAPMLKDCTFAN